MKIAVVFQSKSGNTKKVAQRIAETLGAPLFDAASPPSEPVELLFVGGGIYAGELNPALAAYLKSLTPARVKSVAAFTTSAGGEDHRALFERALSGTGVSVLEKSFGCFGRAFLLARRKHPSQQDLLAAARFAAEAAN